MRSTFGAGLIASAIIVAPAAAFAQGQGQPAGKTATPAAVVAPKMTAEQLAKQNEVLATVNGDKITRGQLIQLLSQYNISPGTEKIAYNTGIEMLVNTRLLTQFLNQKRVKVESSEVDKKLDEYRRTAAENGTSLEKALADSNVTIDQVREQIMNEQQWRKFIEQAATDKALDEYMHANPDIFSGTLVKASHIQINADENASEADKQKAKAKLAEIKKDIQAGKITFADAANKYSEDPANKEQPSGGDLKWFPRTKFTDTFAAAAFALKKGEISDPVQSEWGVHLIQVTDRRDGKMPTLEQVKEKALNQYAVDQQNTIVTDMRKTAKIDINKMPDDFFSKPVTPPVATDPNATKAKGETATQKKP